MNRREYRRLLQDVRWKIKAQFIRKRDGHKCQHCGKKTNRLQVHHTIYITGLNPWEYENETLISLCSVCHKKEHNIKTTKRKKKTTKPAVKKAKAKKRIIVVKTIQDEEYL
jgi:5-methylcytosine-specific restriction endonuclease McrA